MGTEHVFHPNEQTITDGKPAKILDPNPFNTKTLDKDS